MVSEHEHDPFIEEIAGELRRPVRFDSSFESRVMASLDPAVVPLPVGRKSSTPWLLRPRTFYVSPLAGLAVAAGLVAVITMSVLRTVPSGDEIFADGKAQETLSDPLVHNASAAAIPAEITAPFTYIDRTAKSVAVVGSFNDWDATKNALTQTSDSVWSTNIKLPPGRHEYQLVVDGRWIADPNAQRTASSDFGGTNSVKIVSPVPQ